MRIFAYGSHILAYILEYSMALPNPFKRKKPSDAGKTKEKKAPAAEESKVEMPVPEKSQKALGWSGGILTAPHVTEKSSGLAGLHQYVFRVSPEANKLAIARAVEKKYGVAVVRVNTLNVHGKRVRVGKTEGRSPGFKKAIVTLKEGQSIEAQ